MNRSKIFVTAWALYKNGFLSSFGQALRAAWMKARLLRKLKNGIAYFKYAKADGQHREAIGTLAANNFQYQFSNGDEPITTPAHLIKYFDIVVRGFRSCRIDRLLIIE